jgi:RNA polymerase sigma-70 factor (ECF subfamily)
VEAESQETRELLKLARQGVHAAFEELFSRHRERLRQAVAVRLDPRLAQRLDVSDVLQEAYLEASQRLPDYLARPEMPFYLWLWWIAKEKVLAAHRRHLGADKRTLGREVPALPVDSSAQFVSGVMARGPTPSQALAAVELAERLRTALGQLGEEERELILWRHFEHLSNCEVAQLLRVSEAAASKRYIRALERLRGLLLNLGVSGAE